MDNRIVRPGSVVVYVDAAGTDHAALVTRMDSWAQCWIAYVGVAENCMGRQVDQRGPLPTLAALADSGGAFYEHVRFIDQAPIPVPAKEALAVSEMRSEYGDDQENDDDEGRDSEPERFEN